MKFENILLFSMLILLLLHEYSSTKGDSYGKISTKGKEIATSSHGNHGRCNCQKFLISELNGEIEIKGIGFKVQKLKRDLGIGGFGDVKHAFNHIDGKCFALKSSLINKSTKNIVKRELDVLKYFNTLELQQRNHIIKMDNWERADKKMYFVLELGGKTLKNYFHQKVHERNGYLNINNIKKEQLLLTNILKGAAQALQQFHQHGIHLDVKENNFIIALDENQAEPNPDPASTETIPVKLIDFNLSVIPKRVHTPYFLNMAQTNKAPEIFNNNPSNLSNKVDVWSFGLMVYSLYNFHEFSIYSNNEDIMGIVHNNEDIDQNDSLNRLIKACVQINPSDRPEMEGIVQFLNGEIENFEYERREMERLENESLEEQRRKDERRQNRRFGFCFGFC